MEPEPTQEQPPNSRNPAEHLAPHQFKPGQSGNPGGRPRGRSIGTILRDLLEKGEITVRENGKTKTVKLPDGQQVHDMLGEALLRHALKGDIRHIQEVLNRTEGKVPDRIAGPDGEPIFSPARQRKILANPRALELLCELDECTSAPEGDQSGGVRPPGESGSLGLPESSGNPEP